MQIPTMFGKRQQNRAQNLPPQNSMTDYPPLPRAKVVTNPQRPSQPPLASDIPPQAPPPAQPRPINQEPVPSQNQTDQNITIQQPPTNHYQGIPQYHYSLPPFRQLAPLPQMPQYPLFNHQNQMTLPPVYHPFWPPFTTDQSIIPQYIQPRFP